MSSFINGKATALTTVGRVEALIFTVLYALLTDHSTPDVVAWVLTLTEDLQLLQVIWRDANYFNPLPSWFRFIFNPFLIWQSSTSTTTFSIVFAVASMIIVVTYALVHHVGQAFKMGSFSKLWPLRMLRTLTVLVASVLFMPIVEILLSTVSCTDGTLRFTPAISCGAWPQVVLIVIAMLVFVTMLPLNFFLIALNYDSIPPKEAGASVAQPHARYNLLYAFCRLIIAICDILTEEHSPASAIVVCILGIVCFAVLVRTQPHYTAALNHTRAGLLFNTIISSVIAIVSHTAAVDTSSASLIVLAILSPINIIVGYGISKMVLSRITEGIIKRLASKNSGSSKVNKVQRSEAKILESADMDSEEPAVKELPGTNIMDVYHRKVKKPMRVFEYSIDVEIASRFIQNGSTPEMIELLSALWEQGLLEFPDSAFVLLWSTYYVQAYGFADAKYELKRLKIASELGGFADVRYAVFQMTRTATELNHAAITGQADNLKIMELIEHETLSKRARAAHQVSIVQLKIILTELKASRLTLNVLSNVAITLSASITTAVNSYDLLIGRYPKRCKQELRSYAKFQQLVLNNQALAESYIELADSMENSNSPGGNDPYDEDEFVSRDESLVSPEESTERVPLPGRRASFADTRRPQIEQQLAQAIREEGIIAEDTSRSHEDSFSLRPSPSLKRNSSARASITIKSPTASAKNIERSPPERSLSRPMRMEGDRDASSSHGSTLNKDQRLFQKQKDIVSRTFAGQFKVAGRALYIFAGLMMAILVAMYVSSFVLFNGPVKNALTYVFSVFTFETTLLVAYRRARLIAYYGTLGNTAMWAAQKAALSASIQSFAATLTTPPPGIAFTSLPRIINTNLPSPLRTITYESAYVLLKHFTDRMTQLGYLSITAYSGGPPTTDNSYHWIFDNFGEVVDAVSDIINSIIENFMEALAIENYVILSLEIVAIVTAVLGSIIIWETTLRAVSTRSQRVLLLLRSLNKETVTRMLTIMEEELSFIDEESEDVQSDSLTKLKDLDLNLDSNHKFRIWYIGGIVVSIIMFLAMGTYTQSALSSYVRWGGYVQNAGLSRYWRQSATAWATELYAGNDATEYLPYQTTLRFQECINQLSDLQNEMSQQLSDLNGNSTIVPGSDPSFLSPIYAGGGCSTSTACTAPADGGPLPTSIALTALDGTYQALLDVLVSTGQTMVANAYSDITRFDTPQFTAEEFRVFISISQAIGTIETNANTAFTTQSTLAYTSSVLRVIMTCMIVGILAVIGVHYFVFKALLHSMSVKVQYTLRLLWIIPYQDVQANTIIKRFLESGGQSFEEN